MDPKIPTFRAAEMGLHPSLLLELILPLDEVHRTQHKDTMIVSSFHGGRKQGEWTHSSALTLDSLSPDSSRNVERFLRVP